MVAAFFFFLVNENGLRAYVILCQERKPVDGFVETSDA